MATSERTDFGTETRRVTVWHVALLLPWVVAVLGFKRAFNDNSYLWHVRAGDLQAEMGEVLTVDPFSFTLPGEAWRTQSWLAELAYSQLDAWGGLAATPWITSTMTLVLFALLGLIVYRHNRSLPSTVTYLVVSTLLLVAFLNPRPAIFSLPMFAAAVLVDEDGRLRWTIPGIIWIWASVHGAFAIGLVYLACRALGRGLTRKRLVDLFLFGLPALLTAHGRGTVDILFAFVGNQEALDNMTEWYPPDLTTVPFLPLLLGLFGLVYLAGRGKVAKADWWVIVPFVTLAFTASRAVPQAWIALAPVLGRIRLKDFKMTSLSPVAALVFGAMILVGPMLVPFEVEPAEGLFPIEAVENLNSDRVFHDDLVGAWIIYEQWPDRRVFIDDRAEFFSDRIGEMASLRNGGGDWQAVFDRDEIDEALLSTEAPLAEILALAGWSRVYVDEDFVVLRR